MSATGSELLVRVAFAIGIGCLAMSALLATIALLLRAAARRRARRARRVEARWRPLLAASVHALPALPALAPRDLDPFLAVWLPMQEALRGDARDALNRVARWVGADVLARARLARRSARARLPAVAMLGHLGDAAAAPALAALMRGDGPVSLAAAQALLRIDRAAALPDVVALAAARRDWAIARLLVVLREVPATALADALAASIHHHLQPPRQRELSRLLRLAAIADPSRIEPVVRRVLDEVAAPAARAAALARVRHPAFVHHARAALLDPDGRVRAAGADALARIGAATDHAALCAALDDPDDRVRDAATSALGRLASPLAA